MKKLYVSTRMKIREGKIEGFKKQAAECIRLTKEMDRGTLQFDWFLNSDETECEIREVYENSEALADHKHNLQKALGRLFEEYALLPELDALENVYLPAIALGRDKSDYVRAGSFALEQVGLGTRLHHRPREMSGGEQQRVAIARALINNPDILFADEPTANLDSASSDQIIGLFQKLNKDMGLTIMMVTHEPDDVKYVNRVIWLKDGELAEPGA